MQRTKFLWTSSRGLPHRWGETSATRENHQVVVFNIQIKLPHTVDSNAGPPPQTPYHTKPFWDCVSEIPGSGILQKASPKKKSPTVFNPFAQTALSKIADRNFLRLRLWLNGAVQGTPYPDVLPRFFECNTAGSAACFTPQTLQTITSKCQIDWGSLHGSFKRYMAAKTVEGLDRAQTTTKLLEEQPIADDQKLFWV